jgi:hypothetical protein
METRPRPWTTMSTQDSNRALEPPGGSRIRTSTIVGNWVKTASTEIVADVAARRELEADQPGRSLGGDPSRA